VNGSSWAAPAATRREGDGTGVPVLTSRELQAIVRLVYEKSGIALSDAKHGLVSARLQKRLRHGGFSSYASYLAHVERDTSGQELTELLDAIATNHTSFFREPQHFEFLRTHVFPAAAVQRRAPAIWSAACSRGDEPYTIAMTLRDHLPEPLLGDARVLASDLSTKALRVASAGVYPLDHVADLPPETLRRHFERGLGAQDGLARVATAVRAHVQFRRLNLLDITSLGQRFDVIFCRNVMIYFDQPTQQRVVSMLERHLAPSGYLFISHSESLNGIDHRLRWVAPAIYQQGPA
jgi:chemotaxis protein methyltransferase CheR